MRKNNQSRWPQRHLSAVLLLPLLLTAASAPAAGETSTWSYRYYKDDVALKFYPLEIILYDPTPPADLASASGPRRLLLPDGVVATVEDLGDGWSVVDLSGAPSGEDPEGYALDLIDSYTTDPTDDIYAGPVFGEPSLRMAVKSTVHVGFEADVSQAIVDAVLQAAGLGTVLQSNWIRPNIFRTTSGMRSGVDVLAAANALAMDPDVRFATVNWLFMGPDLVDEGGDEPPASLTSSSLGQSPLFSSTSSVSASSVAACMLPGLPPDDPFFFASWALEQANGLDLNALGAWGVCSGDGTSAIAILDNGVQPDHPDLAGNILPGSDMTSDCAVSGNPVCDGRSLFPECEVHGTAVAGVAVGLAGNGLGTAGIAPNLKVVSIRTGRSVPFSGRCRHASEPVWVANGLMRALALGVRVTNLSWNYGINLDPVMQEAYEVTAEAGLMHFNSAGNNGFSTVTAPGTIPEVHAISGVDANGQRMRDGAKISNIGSDVAFSAPAQLLLTTDIAGADGWSTGGAFGLDHVHVTGTSYASPMAAAIAVMVFVIRPSWTAEDVWKAMKRNALDLGDPGRDDLHGDGFLNAQATLEYARDMIFSDGFERGTTSRWTITSGATP